MRIQSEFSPAASKSNILQSRLRSSLLLGRFVVEQMCNNDCGVIDHLLLLHPPSVRLLHEAIDSLRWSGCREEQVYGLIVLDEFPESSVATTSTLSEDGFNSFSVNSGSEITPAVCATASPNDLNKEDD